MYWCAKLRERKKGRKKDCECRERKRKRERENEKERERERERERKREREKERKREREREKERESLCLFTPKKFQNPSPRVYLKPWRELTSPVHIQSLWPADMIDWVTDRPWFNLRIV